MHPEAFWRRWESTSSKKNGVGAGARFARIQPDFKFQAAITLPNIQRRASASAQEAGLANTALQQQSATAESPSGLCGLKDQSKGMNNLRRAVLAFTFIVVAMVTGSPTFAEVTNASPEEIDWFVGKWKVGPADVPGFETIIGDTGSCEDAVVITKSSDTTIRRRSKTRSGETAEFEFEVMKFGENFPWWPSDGPGPVAKKTGDDVFILASTTNGMADWDRGLQHTRCPE